MTSQLDADNFDASLGCLISPALGELATQLASVAGLQAHEREIVVAATSESLFEIVHAKLGRVLLLELNAARISGQLTGDDPRRRWQQFSEISSQRSFWDGLAVHYPSLLPRIDAIMRHRCTASLSFARRWAADRSKLAGVCGGDPGELRQLSFGAGDSHRGGQTVAIVHCDGGRVVYKPRSLAIDIALREFITGLVEAYGSPLTIQVPKVLTFPEHGWIEFVEHRYAADAEELRNFYRGIGHWLAIMRLLSGSDLHSENLIAHGASPTVVDCETLFTPRIPQFASGFGQAADRASELLSGTVLGVGLLPGRGMGLAWRGVDISAVGGLPGQQPKMTIPGIVEAGSDHARLGTIEAEAPASQNHPSSEPALAEYWPEVLDGFDTMTATLQRLDAAGELHGRLRVFEDCHIRVVPRSTEVYAELMRMLWHPVSLHKQAPARQRAFELLEKMAKNLSIAPDDPVVIEAEIDELMEGDIPFFTTRVRDGRLQGPRGTWWLQPCNLVDAALAHWRAADFELERNVIQVSLVSAYLSDGWEPKEVSKMAPHGRGGDLDKRRRQQAAGIMRSIVSHAICGDDGSITWIALQLGEEGWAVQPLQQDLYGGLSGIVLLAGAYLREIAAQRADPVDGLDEMFKAGLRSLHMAEDQVARQRAKGIKLRPPTPGAYLGLGSQIWTHLVLAHWGMDNGEGLDRARSLAEQIPVAVAADNKYDLYVGSAGAITPLLLLARNSGDERYLRMAMQIGDRLSEHAARSNGHACWKHPDLWPDGLGGFAHGVTGIGWALTRLARATGSDRYGTLAQAAFSFEDSLFDEEEQNWLDLRKLHSKTAAAWCNGSVGIGLAHLDLDPKLAQVSTRTTLQRAAAATWRDGIGWTHCACHGDLSAWELLDRAIAAGLGPKELSATQLLDRILTSLEQQGPVCGLARDSFAPGLMPGIGGVVYQLLRMHPQHDLPSILMPAGEEL